MGVVSAGMVLAGFDLKVEHPSNVLAIVMYIALILFLAISCLKAKKEN